MIFRKSLEAIKPNDPNRIDEARTDDYGQNI
jgi:hypothetical protein